jgi:hypothetical protein
MSPGGPSTEGSRFSTSIRPVNRTDSTVGRLILASKMPDEFSATSSTETKRGCTLCDVAGSGFPFTTVDSLVWGGSCKESGSVDSSTVVGMLPFLLVSLTLMASVLLSIYRRRRSVG